MNRTDQKSQMLTDETLVLRIQQGDKEAFALFFERHRATMHLAAYHLLHDTDDADDAVQDLFSKVWQHAARIDVKGNIKGYLYTLLRNQILTAMNRSKYLDEYIDSFLAFGQQEACNTEEALLANELEQILEEKINQLPAKMREVYALSWHKNLSNKEIASQMDISEGTVKQHKYQATRMLRAKLQRLVSISIF